MTKYREIIRLASLSLSQTNIALSCGVSPKTVNNLPGISDHHEELERGRVF